MPPSDVERGWAHFSLNVSTNVYSPKSPAAPFINNKRQPKGRPMEEWAPAKTQLPSQNPSLDPLTSVSAKPTLRPQFDFQGGKYGRLLW